jgi:CBS domain-containing protein
MKVNDVINKNIITISEDTKVKDLLAIMHESKQTLFPIKSNGKVVGIVTYHDLLKTPLNYIDSITVKSIMRRDFPIIYPFENLSNALRKMLNYKIDTLLVIDPKDNSFLGVVNEMDIIIGHEKIRQELEEHRVGKEFTVESIMKIDPIVIHPDSKIEEFYEIVRKHGYNTYPVVENGILVGYISLKSLYKSDNIRYVKDAMNTNPVTIYKDESIERALEKMFKSKSDMLMVIEDTKIGKRLLGIVTKSDILLAYSALL